MREWLQQGITSLVNEWVMVWAPGLLALLWHTPSAGFLVLAGFIFLDLILGSVAALTAGTWRFGRYEKTVWKLVQWGALLLVSVLLRSVSGMDGSWELHKIGDWLVCFAILTEAVSCLININAIAILHEVRVPGFNKLIDALERLNRNTIDKLDKLAGPGTTARLREEDAKDAKQSPDTDV